MRLPLVGALGPLSIVGSILLISAGVRLAAQDMPSRSPVRPGPIETPETSLQSCQTDEDLQMVLDALQERQARLDADELKIKAQLDEASNRISIATAKQAEAEMAEKRLRETMSLSQTVAEEDLSQLTTVYERMKPKSAAALFEEMDPGFSAGFLGRMKPDSAAAVLAALSPEAAYSISVILAGRNAEAGK